jgi:dihydropteroate synthase
MGVLNVTPDSFSDGGRFTDPDAAVAEGVRMAEDGADLIDVGGESTRPGAQDVPAEVERDRVVPVIRALAETLSVPVSVDTRKPDVAAAAVEVGATVINDVTGGRDPRMFEVARDAGTGLVLMHMRGDPSTMRELTEYDDVVAEVKEYLRQRIETAEFAGIPAECVCVDPGLGFAKTPEQSLLLMREIGALADLGRPVMAGPSRKSFIGHVLDAGVGQRLEGTAAAVGWLAANGAHIVRVHDVAEMVRVVRVVDAIRGAAAAG